MIVWLASYPRSGNTFLRVVLGAVFGLETYTLYDERPEAAPELGPAPPLPLSGPEPLVGLPFDVRKFAGRSELHVVKTHDPPRDARPAIYVVRDGREATASYFHYHRDVLDRPVSIDSLIRGKVGFGSWGRHVATWNPQRRPNTLVLRFEELTANPIAQVERIGSFLGVKPVGRRVPSFDDLKRTAPTFFRSGRTDSWRKLFTHEEHALFWDLHGDEMRAFAYAGEPAASGSVLLRRSRRAIQRFTEAARPYTEAGQSAGRRALASLVRSPAAAPISAERKRRAA